MAIQEPDRQTRTRLGTVSAKSGKRRAPTRKKPGRGASTPPVWQRALTLGVEVLALVGAALIVIMAALGRTAERFAGAGLWSNLLPFSSAVLGLAVLSALLLRFWLSARVWLAARKATLPALVAVCFALAAGGYSARPDFRRDLGNLRSLVGGVDQAERATLAHQVFAAYRRADLAAVSRMLERSRTYLPAIEEAAEAYQLDAEILVGLAAAESSFRPRDSKDGGHGLFQITAPPKPAVARAKKQLGVDHLDLADRRHNAYAAAATLQHYLAEMRGDLFLGLLAYNIGPKNGGLRSIVQQYGARDFITIQPYLQNLPRDYPIRVLAAALAYRLWRTEGKLPRYEEGNNALRIQNLGIPGLTAEFG